MYKLHVLYYICNGPKQCGECETILPGFQTEHHGELLINEREYNENQEMIDYAVESCPRDALCFDVV